MTTTTDNSDAVEHEYYTEEYHHHHHHRYHADTVTSPIKYHPSEELVPLSQAVQVTSDKQAVKQLMEAIHQVASSSSKSNNEQQDDSSDGRQLQNSGNLGGGGNLRDGADETNLNECEGDCDVDSDCIVSYIMLYIYMCVLSILYSYTHRQLIFISILSLSFSSIPTYSLPSLIHRVI